MDHLCWSTLLDFQEMDISKIKTIVWKFCPCDAENRCNYYTH